MAEKITCDPANPRGDGVVDVWQEKCTVRFGSIDKSDKMTLDAVFKFFQEAAICHAENLGVGREDMARTKQGWILSRITVLIDKRPNYWETVTVKSWPRGFEKLFAIRDYQIIDSNNNAVVSARSGWLIVDMDKRRPLRPQAVMDAMPQNEGFNALSPEVCAITGLAERSDLQKVSERKALYTDVDYNGHVNNVRYIEWIQDTLDPQLLEKAKKIRIDINYLNEILSGETAEIFSAPIQDDDFAAKAAGAAETAGTNQAFAFEGRKTENGQAAFRAELRIYL